MPHSENRLACIEQLEKNISAYPLINFPTQLPARLKALDALAQSNQNRLNQALNPLLDRLCLLSFHLFDVKIAANDQEKARMAQHIIECLDLLETIIQEPEKAKSAFESLQKKLRAGDFELRTYHSSWKHVPLTALDAAINGVNTARSFVFRMPYPRSRLSTHDYIAQELQRFLLSAEHSSTRQVLSALLPREKSTVPVQENELVHLAAEVNQNYQRFCSSNSAQHQVGQQIARKNPRSQSTALRCPTVLKSRRKTLFHLRVFSERLGFVAK